MGFWFLFVWLVLAHGNGFSKCWLTCQELTIWRLPMVPFFRKKVKTHFPAWQQEKPGSFTLTEAFQVAPGPTQPQFGPRRHFILDSSLSKAKPFFFPKPGHLPFSYTVFFLSLSKLLLSSSSNNKLLSGSHSDHSMETALTGFSKNFPAINSLDSTFY